MLHGPFEAIAFRCPRCGGDAQLDVGAVVCAACDAAYRVRKGSIDFMGPYRLEDASGDAELEQQSEAIRAALTLPPEFAGDVRDAVDASRERTGVSYVDAEIAALPIRFGLEAAPLAQESAPPLKARMPLTFLSHHCPPEAAASAKIWRTVRVRANRSLAGRARERLRFCYRFRKASAGLIERLVPPRHQRAAVLPVDLDAGREISVTLPVSTPAEPGAYLLDISAGGWPLTTIPITVGASENQTGVTVGAGIADYGADHQHALDVLEAYVDAHLGASRLMLEVASGVHPHLLRFAVKGHRVVATDICSNMMQLGALSARHHMPQTREMLGFASADAFAMPFRPGQFDVVAMFAALHHFPEPVAFLNRLKPLLAQSGVIAVMCEPCDPPTAILGEGYIRDLAAGINEQVFSVEEYRLIFARAGLVERSIRNDGGSLKAILAPG